VKVLVDMKEHRARLRRLPIETGDNA